MTIFESARYVCMAFDNIIIGEQLKSEITYMTYCINGGHYGVISIAMYDVLLPRNRCS